MSGQNLRTCNKCGWVHFGVTKATLASLQMSDPASYMKCFRCANPASNFRQGLEADCPMGSTIQGIFVEDDGEAPATDESSLKD